MVADGHPEIIPFPLELRPRAPMRDVLVLGDMDALSHGLAERSGADRASDSQAGALLTRVQATAWAVGARRCRLRLAASSVTARHHLGLVTVSANNTWSIRTGLDGADSVIVEELDSLAAAVCAARERRRACGHADLVMLIGQDHAYGPAVRRLKLLGVPTWVLQPGRYIAHCLYRAATCVTPLTPPLAA